MVGSCWRWRPAGDYVHRSVLEKPTTTRTAGLRVRGTISSKKKKGKRKRRPSYSSSFPSQPISTLRVLQWHLGHSNLYHPTYRGFTTYTGLPYSGDMGCLDLNPRGCGDGHHAGPSCPQRCGADDRGGAAAAATETAIPLYASSNDWDGTNCSKRNCSQEIVLAPFNPNSLNQVRRSQSDHSE